MTKQGVEIMQEQGKLASKTIWTMQLHRFLIGRSGTVPAF